jgi:Cellulase (glycosyl hydrolase family 5)
MADIDHDALVALVNGLLTIPANPTPAVTRNIIVTAAKKANGILNPPVPPPPPPPSGTAFKVSGTQLLDTSGKVFVPFGFNVGAPDSFDWRGIALGHGADAKAWGCNIVRLNLYVTNSQSWSRVASSGYAALLSDVAGVVSEYNAQGIVVMIEQHEDPTVAGLGPQISQFWKDIVATYKSNPMVWINYANEYGWSDGVDYLVRHKAWISEVRGYGYTGPYIADAMNAGNDAGWAGSPQAWTYGPQLQASDPLHNVVVSHHNYGGVDDSIGSSVYYDQVHAAGVCMIVGEFGQTNNGSVGAGTYQQNVNGVNSVCSLARTKGVGAIAWHGTHGDNYSMKNNSNAFWDGGNSANLSVFGTKFWALLHP